MTTTTTPDKQKNINFFQNLLLVAISDRYLDTAESDFLVQIGNQLGLSEADVNFLSEDPNSLGFVIPATVADRTQELKALINMMLQDGEIHPKEYALCTEYAERVGFDKKVLDDLIGQMQQR